MKIDKEFAVKSTELKDIANALKMLIPNGQKLEDVIFLCIGTDRSTGDSLGPYIGTKLKEKGYKNVYGTLDEPVHAMNLEETIANFSKDKFVIAFDACLGHSASVGYIQVVNGPLRPGAGVGKNLPHVGDIHMTGIVNVGGFMEYFVLQNTRLSLVMQLGNKILNAVDNVFANKKEVTPVVNFKIHKFHHKKTEINVKRKVSGNF